jgi:hypothetical protein
LDSAVAAGGDQLGEDVFDGFRAAGVKAALFALAAEGEVGGGVGGVGIDGCKVGVAADANGLLRGA